MTRHLHLQTLRTAIGQSLLAADWWICEFWRFVFVQQEVARLAQTAIDYPPMQTGASFSLDAVKQKIQKAMNANVGH